jgi:flagellar biosynthesis component FlhA
MGKFRRCVLEDVIGLAMATVKWRGRGEEAEEEEAEAEAGEEEAAEEEAEEEEAEEEEAEEEAEAVLGWRQLQNAGLPCYRFQLQYRNHF